jgi:membrane protein DedA with SNARE-associated domain
VVGVLGTIADWLAPALLVAHPLLVVGLDPKIRYLALTAERVALPVWFAAAFVRLFATDPLWYLLGRWYGDDAASWLERRLGMGRTLRLVERWFGRASWPIVAAAPDGLVCLLAGATGMSPLTFVVLDVIGTVGRFVLVRALVGPFGGQIAGVGHLVGRYAWWLVAMSVTLTAARMWRHSRTRHGPEMIRKASA